jgi:hypothetical protein
MGATTLVSDEIAAGHNVVAALDAAGFPAKAAFWLYDSDVDVWKLWIATPQAGEDLQKAFMKVGKILTAITDRSVLDLSRIKLVTPEDPTVRAIRSLINVKGLSDIRFKSNVVNGIYIADALIYRTAA